MKMIHASSKIITVLYVVLPLVIFTAPGCSYVSDAIEGAITNRAGFSIDAYYDGSDVGSDVIVSWSESGSGDGFAGYEVYMTDEPNNEFADYIVVGAPVYNSTHIGTSTYYDDTLNSLKSSRTFTHHSTFLPPTGVYFYRVGIISWDKIDADGDGEDDEYPDPTYNNYISKTSVSEISGSARVEIP
ncbi:MAG: hypothetical protein ACOCX9_04975 [Spirochaetota bacterium]